MRLDKVYSSSTTHRQVFREAVYPLVQELTRGQSSTVVLIGGRHAGKWEMALGPKLEHGSSMPVAKPAVRGSLLAPATSPAGVSPAMRFAGSPLAGTPGALVSAGSLKTTSSSSSGLISMILDMVYEHAKQVEPT